jgi:hypothetical protein
VGVVLLQVLQQSQCCVCSLLLQHQAELQQQLLLLCVCAASSNSTLPLLLLLPAGIAGRSAEVFVCSYGSQHMGCHALEQCSGEEEMPKPSLCAVRS